MKKCGDRPETEESLNAMHEAYEAADQEEYAAYMDELDAKEK